MVDVILGLQWGDEGKGKIVDFFAKDYDLIARFQGGPNAGHTLYVNDKKVVLHQIPSGIFHEEKTNLIGSGVVLDAVTLRKECNAVASFGVDYKKNLFILDVCLHTGGDRRERGCSHCDGPDQLDREQNPGRHQIWVT
jgi:adenylosuccinate synthase